MLSMQIYLLNLIYVLSQLFGLCHEICKTVIDVCDVTVTGHICFSKLLSFESIQQKLMEM